MIRTIVLAAALGGCIPHAEESEQKNILRLHPQPEVAGGVKVTIANDLEGFMTSSFLCDVRVIAGGGQAPNMMTGGQFTSGISADIGLRPGRYRFEATTCTGEKRTTNATVAGPTTIHFGYAKHARAQLGAAAGAQVYVEFTMPSWVAHPPPPPQQGRQGPGPKRNCLPGGDMSTGIASECCTGVILISQKRPNMPSHCAYPDEVE